MPISRSVPRATFALLALAGLLLSLATPSSAQSPPEPSGTDAVISQVYGGGGNSGATLTNDFVEVFNRGDAPVDLSGWSVQYASSSGSGWQVAPLSGSLAPGQYHLVELGAGAGGTQALPSPDSTGSIAMSASSGKVALVEDAASLVGSCPSEVVVDLVGYGSANCFEGSDAAPGLSNTTAALRAGAGCLDTDDNAADLATGDPAPRNSSTELAPCGGVSEPNEPVVAVCEDLTVAAGASGSAPLSATDADGVVVAAAITDGDTDAIALTGVTPANEAGDQLTVGLSVEDGLVFGSYPVEVTFSNDDGVPQEGSCTVTVTVAGEICDGASPLTAISDIQGDGAVTPLEGQRVLTRGVVTADLSSGGATGVPENEGLRGFYIEAPEADRDDDPLTSEGVFVFDGAGEFDGEVGDLVHVAGTAGEFSDVTQVSATDIADCGDEGVDTGLPPAADLPMPIAPDERDTVFEPLESMRVTHPELTVTDFWQLERFGEVFLSSDGVLANPTNHLDPSDTAAVEAAAASNAANTILLDDGRTGQNLDPLPYVEPGDTLRVGDQLIEQTTILHFGFGEWRLQPIDVDELTQAFQDGRTRPRPVDAPEVGGSLTVASFNVLNYFNGDGYVVGDDPETAEGFPTSRGAVSPSEFERQTAKIVAAIEEMDADILGLVEIENDAGPDQAAAALVEAINDTMGEGTYEYLDTGTIGTDEIKLAYLYKPSTVEPTGDHAILDGDVDPRFEDERNRPVLTQTFTERRTDSAVTVSVNHLKSKGSACEPEDNDPWQGNCNGVRLRAAQAMADWLATDPTGVEGAGDLIIGDLNAYAEEDPIAALEAAGYTDLLERYAEDGVMPYTYTFSATQGYLDHALADDDLLDWVTGAGAWNINADEVPAIDYLEGGPGRFRTELTGELYYQPTAFRSSDHDPVLVGLGLPPGSRDVCKRGGWREQNLEFRNQGRCVSYVATRHGS